MQYSAQPVDSNLFPRTQSLFDHLHYMSGEFAMIGHQDDTLCAHAKDSDSDVFRVTGGYPGVWGFDIGRIELDWSENIDGISFSNIRREMRRAYDMGAVVTLSWHSVNPITEKGYGENMAYNSVASVLPKGGMHKKYLRWLDHVADFLASVKDDAGEPIPIVFRPFHEHTGTWFWWCTGSSMESTETTQRQFADLWRTTVEYLRDNRGVHNVLYAYSPDRSRIDMTSAASCTADYLFGYPGDQYVDILGLDDYWDFNQDIKDKTASQCHANLIDMLSLVGQLAENHGKLAANTETGSPENLQQRLRVVPHAPGLDSCSPPRLPIGTPGVYSGICRGVTPKKQLAAAHMALQHLIRLTQTISVISRTRISCGL